MDSNSLSAASTAEQSQSPSTATAMSSNGRSPCRVIKASTIVQSLLDEVSEDLSRLGRSPLLVGLLANDDPAARMYANWTNKTCTENGFQYELREVDRQDLEQELIGANRDDNVDGIIVYYPIYGNRQDQYLQQIPVMDKDVEGLNHRYIFNMYQNIRFLDERQQKKSILVSRQTTKISVEHHAYQLKPCTPLAIVKTLEYLQLYNMSLPYGDRLSGHTITVINRSEVVGRPLAALLANDGASVYSVDVTGVQLFTRGEGLRKRRHEVVDKLDWKMEDCLPLSGVVISGVPGTAFKVPTASVKEGAVCINFSSDKNFSPDIKERASISVPTIGKVTVVILLRNLLVS
ncbi:MAG: hypothetical protein M1823_003736 [Watsoniomyces obsoletus]|nr:MAG: hypothetical protein M1823_003736 [Watsoniomyces obsoletus]